MDSERWRRVDELFNACIDLPAHERSDYLDSACGVDASLRAEVESLLDADERDDPGFEQIVPQTAEAVLDLTAPLARRRSCRGLPRRPPDWTGWHGGRVSRRPR